MNRPVFGVLLWTVQLAALGRPEKAPGLIHIFPFQGTKRRSTQRMNKSNK